MSAELLFVFPFLFPPPPLPALELDETDVLRLCPGLASGIAPMTLLSLRSELEGNRIWVLAMEPERRIDEVRAMGAGVFDLGLLLVPLASSSS